MTPKISVIVPVYNTSKYLENCLNSIKHQSMKEIEVIVIDDGSSDSSPEICDKYVSEQNFKIFHTENSGVSKARNFGLNRASGKYLTFVDSDDWLEPNACERMYQCAERYKVDLVITAHWNDSSIGSVARIMYSGNRVFSSKNNSNSQMMSHADNNKDYYSEIQIHTLGLIGDKLKNPSLLDRHTPIWARLYRTDIIKQNNIRFLDLKKLPSECLQFNFEYTRIARSAFFLNEPLYHYRRNTISSVTKPYRNDLSKKWKWWYDYIVKNYISSFNDEYEKAFYSRISCSVIPLGGNALKQSSYLKIRNECRNFLNDDVLQESFKHFDYHQCPLHWRLFFTSAKRKWTDLFVLLTWCMRRILDLRKK